MINGSFIRYIFIFIFAIAPFFETNRNLIGTPDRSSKVPNQNGVDNFESYRGLGVEMETLSSLSKRWSQIILEHAEDMERLQLLLMTWRCSFVSYIFKILVNYQKDTPTSY